MYIYILRKYLKGFDGSATEFVGVYKVAYKSKEDAEFRRDKLNLKSQNYIYSIYCMELN